ncbi:MAG: TonB-dependent receptor [Gammaproteobacteria bacterium]|nr:MAG: TonB-dependent receptor [Gammaproteobacteria bacterium]
MVDSALGRFRAMAGANKPGKPGLAPLSRNGSRTTAGFGIVDAGLDIGIRRGLRLLVEGQNLADKRYAYDEGFPEAGRSWAATLVWNPGTGLPKP